MRSPIGLSGWPLFLGAFLSFAVPISGWAQEDSPAPSSNLLWLLQELDSADFDSPFRRSHFAGESCKALIALGMQKEALHIWQANYEMLQQEDRRSAFPMLEAALAMQRFDLAQKLIPEEGQTRNEMLDRVSLAKYKLGHKRALEDYPHGKPLMTFYDAMDLARLYVELGELEQLDGFLEGLEITEENQPEDVAGIVYIEIANEARKVGDMEQAKRYTEKAFQIAGRMYYTGYHITIANDSLHGRLMENLDKRIQQAVAYRGHMARELIQQLIGELARNREFDAAIRIANDFLEAEADRAASLSRLALLRAEQGDYRGALGMVRGLGNANLQNLARLQIASAMIQAHREDAARQMLQFVLPRLKATPDFEAHYKLLAEIGGLLDDRDLIETALRSSSDSLPRTQLLLKALQGYTLSAAS